MTDSSLDQRYYERAYGLNQQSRLQEKINLDEGFFQKLCYEKLEEAKLDPAELVRINKFITIIEKINERYPFLYLPNFIKDFMTGIFSKHLLTKYHLRSYGELSHIKRNILQLKAERVKDSNKNSLEKNLAIPEWDKLYNFLINESQNFYEILLELINHNLLRAIIILFLIEKKEGVTKNEILQNIETIVKIYKNQINLFDEKGFEISFNEYIKTNFESKVNAILISLEEKNYIIRDTSARDNYLIMPKYQDISKKIFEILEQFSEGKSQSSFHKILLQELPLLKLIPKVGLWEYSLEKLEKDGQIIRKKAFWRYRPFRDQLFTRTHYEKTMKVLQEQIIEKGITKFCGRRISPGQFIEELLLLEKGSLDDIDDQVTRIAGLVLAGSAILKTPSEEFEEFDFAVDLSNYQFTSEQMQAMQKIKLQLTAKIIHCKVMISEKITEDLINKIKQILPSGHQTIIFNFEKITTDVQKLIEDKSIQIIDKKGIEVWASITPVIPCRLSSIAKVIYGDFRGKLVRINSVNYESGFAEVIIIPTMEETNLYIGSLEEIPLHESIQNDFNIFSKNYFEFLKIISENSDEIEFEKGFFGSKIKKMGTLKKSQSTDTEYFVESVRKINHVGKWYIELENNTVEINPNTYGFRNIFKCSCYHWVDKDHSFTFCSHLIAALNRIGIECNFFDETWNEGNQVTFVLKAFIENNDELIINKLAEHMDNSQRDILLSYLQNYSKMLK